MMVNEKDKSRRSCEIRMNLERKPFMASVTKQSEKMAVQ